MKENKTINLVIGLGKSGFWAAKYLNYRGENVIVIDNKKNESLNKSKKELEKAKVKVILNKPFEFKEFSHLIQDIKSVIISPGINLENQTVLELQKAGIKILGEASIGWESLKDLNWVGVTGTNGKSTVTHLLSHILQFNKLSAPFAGNIGIPLCKFAYDSKIHKKKIDWIIAELSSYQLEIAKDIQPNIGIWTTFTPDHLERHKTIENYFNIKNNLLIKSKFRIYNYDDKCLRDSINILKEGAWVTTSSNEEDIKKCDYWINKRGYLLEKDQILFEINQFKLIGNHNLQNLLLVTAAARKIGLTSNQISKSLTKYVPLPHRLEIIYKSKSLVIINDSKATNFDSSTAGINSINESFIIISGGIIKEGDSSLWLDSINKKAHSIFLYGQSGNELKTILDKGKFRKEVFIFNNLSEIINIVIKFAKSNNIKTILFSPACSSFDQFKNFEERGEYFKSLVKLYLKKYI